MLKHVLIAALMVPGVAFAAGGDSSPTTTQTTKVCTEGKIYDKATKACVDAQESSLSDDVLYEAAREFAYAGQYQNARDALAAMDVQNDGRVQTYLGFTARKLGETEKAMLHYTAALAQNPNNILARSYMGQGFVEMGKMKAAKTQLSEIRARGGRNTWAEFSLAQTIRSGVGFSY